MPMISTSSPVWITPRSIRPVTTVPRPVIENTSSTGIRNGFSIVADRLGDAVVAGGHELDDLLAPLGVALERLERRDPDHRHVVAGELVGRLSSSRTSSSTSSRISSSSTMSALFSATTMYGTPTWRASSTCSRVCGIGPSVAATTRIAPSICAAPVIMFLM